MTFKLFPFSTHVLPDSSRVCNQSNIMMFLSYLLKILVFKSNKSKIPKFCIFVPQWSTQPTDNLPPPAFNIHFIQFYLHHHSLWLNKIPTIQFFKVFYFYFSLFLSQVFTVFKNNCFFLLSFYCYNILCNYVIILVIFCRTDEDIKIFRNVFSTPSFLSAIVETFFANKDNLQEQNKTSSRQNL